MENNKVNYTTESSCWYKLAGSIIRAAAEGEFDSNEELNAINDLMDESFDKIEELSSGGLKNQLCVMLLDESISRNFQIESRMNKIKDEIFTKDLHNEVMNFKELQKRQVALESKIDKHRNFFNNVFFENISAGVPKDAVRREMKLTKKHDALWENITKTSNGYVVKMTKRQMRYLKLEGFNDGGTFDNFEDARKLRDYLLENYKRIKIQVKRKEREKTYEQ